MRKQSKEHALRSILMRAADRTDEDSLLWVAVVAQTLIEASFDFRVQFLGKSDAAKSRRREAKLQKAAARLHMQRDGFAKDCEMAGLDVDYVFEHFCKMEAAA